MVVHFELYLKLHSCRFVFHLTQKRSKTLNFLSLSRQQRQRRQSRKNICTLAFWNCSNRTQCLYCALCEQHPTTATTEVKKKLILSGDMIQDIDSIIIEQTRPDTKDMKAIYWMSAFQRRVRERERNKKNNQRRQWTEMVCDIQLFQRLLSTLHDTNHMFDRKTDKNTNIESRSNETINSFATTVAP